MCQNHLGAVGGRGGWQLKLTLLGPTPSGVGSENLHFDQLPGGQKSLDGLSPWIIFRAASTICQFDLLEKFYCTDHLKFAQIRKKLSKLEAMKKWLPSSSSSGTINWGHCISNWWLSMKRWLDMNLISDSQPELGMEIALEKGEEISFKKRKTDMKNSST